MISICQDNVNTHQANRGCEFLDEHNKHTSLVPFLRVFSSSSSNMYKFIVALAPTQNYNYRYTIHGSDMLISYYLLSKSQPD